MCHPHYFYTSFKEVKYFEKLREHVEGVMDKNGHIAGSISTELKFNMHLYPFKYLINDVSSPVFVIRVSKIMENFQNKIVLRGAEKYAFGKK